MKALAPLASLTALLALNACGGGQESTAEKLEEAAAQSDPAAAPILENAADAVAEGNDAAAQAALQAAGNAQAGTVPQQQPAPPSTQAQVNRDGQQVPPPKTTVEQDKAADEAAKR